MSKDFFRCFASRMKRINIFILVWAVFLLSLAVFNDVYGAAQASKSASSKNNEDLISLPGEDTGSSKTKTTAAVPKTKYPSPNEMLQGVVYDLKRTKDLKPSDLVDGNTANMKKAAYYSGVFESITKPFVNGPDSSWQRTMDNRGNIRYPYFDKYYCFPNRLFNSFFYMEQKEWTEAPKMLHADGDLQGGGWIAI